MSRHPKSCGAQRTAAKLSHCRRTVSDCGREAGRPQIQQRVDCKGDQHMSSFSTRETTGADEVAVQEVEGQIREFVRRDFVAARREPANESQMVASNISALLQRVSGHSVQEIDRLIGELQALRETLHQEARARSARDRRLCELEPVGDAVDQDHRGYAHRLEKSARRSQHHRLKQATDELSRLGRWTVFHPAAACAAATGCSTRHRHADCGALIAGALIATPRLRWKDGRGLILRPITRRHARI